MAQAKPAAEASDDVGAPVRHVRCVLCRKAPCDCPSFGTPAYYALLNERHGKG